MILEFVKRSRVGFIYLLFRSLLWTLGALFAVIAAVVLLWVNEGLPRLSEIIEDAPVLELTDTSTRSKRPAVLEGELRVPAPATDPTYLVDQRWLEVQRHVEVYAWQETVEVSEERRFGGGREIEKHYSYELQWTTTPADSSTFAFPDGHENGVVRTPQARFHAGQAYVGAWELGDIMQWPSPGMRQLPLAHEELRLSEGEVRSGNAIYVLGADPNTPSAGDERIRFMVSDAEAWVTAIGAPQQGRLVTASSTGFPVGAIIAADRDAAIHDLAYEEGLRIWGVRLGGTLLLWFGFFSFFSIPIALADLVPMAGTLLRVVVGVVTLPMAMLLGALTIGLSIVGHNLLWTIGVLFAGLGVVLFLYYVVPLYRDDIEV